MDLDFLWFIVLDICYLRYFSCACIAFLGALVENHTRIYLSDGTVQDLAVHGGFVDVAPDHVTILSDSAELAADIDVNRARTALQRAEDAMRGEHDATVESALRRAHARLAAAGGVTDTRAAAH